MVLRNKLLCGSSVAVTLEMNAAWLHEFHDGGSDDYGAIRRWWHNFRSEGARQAADAADLGLRLTTPPPPYSISVQCDTELKDGDVGQTGLLKAQVEF